MQPFSLRRRKKLPLQMENAVRRALFRRRDTGIRHRLTLPEGHLKALTGGDGVVIAPAAEPGHHQPRRDAAVDDADGVLRPLHHRVMAARLRRSTCGALSPWGQGLCSTSVIHA